MLRVTARWPALAVPVSLNGRTDAMLAVVAPETVTVLACAQELTPECHERE